VRLFHPTLDQLQKKFGKFNWKPKGGGYIKVLDEDWYKDNIRTVEIPVIGKLTCHKLVALSLYIVFYRIEQRGLAKNIDIDEFKNNVAGCYVNRCVMWDCKNGISCHAFGVAIDLNVKKNPYGGKPNQHPGIVEEFEKEGWIWGANFRTPDPMHFEVGVDINGNWYFTDLKFITVLRSLQNC
jgi:hypothetical protein